MKHFLQIFCLLLGVVKFAYAAPVTLDADICVYGGTSGGVTAAVAAARLGKSVVLVSLNNHLGGMSASGLGVTDISLSPANEPSYIGGLSREFYTRVGQQYGSSSQVYYFEPKVAERVFWQMATNAGVSVFTNQLLAFSRQQVLAPKVIDINEVVKDVEKLLRRLIGADIALTSELAPNLGKVKADPSQLEQVILNLAVNARDAMPAGGRLSFETSNVDLREVTSNQHLAVPPGYYAMLTVTVTDARE